MKCDKIKYIKLKTKKLTKEEKKIIKKMKKLRSLSIEFIENESKLDKCINAKIKINYKKNYYDVNLSIERIENETTKIK